MKSYIIHKSSFLFEAFLKMPRLEIANHQIDGNIDEEYFKFGILIKDEDACIGRVVAYDNPYHQTDNIKTLSLGYYESISEMSVAMLIFDTVKEYCKDEGYTRMIGPINGSTWNSYRFQTYGDESTFFLEDNHLAYYHQQWKECGFDTLAKYRSDKIVLGDRNIVKDHSDYLAKRQITISTLENRNLVEEIEKIGKLSLDSFTNNYLFSPVSIEKFTLKYSRVQPYIDPRYVLVAEQEGELVGYVFAIPNYLDKSKKGLIIKTLARANKAICAGLGTVLTSVLIAKANQEEYDYIINAYYHDDNISGNISKKFNGLDFKRYELLSVSWS